MKQLKKKQGTSKMETNESVMDPSAISCDTCVHNDETCSMCVGCAKHSDREPKYVRPAAVPEPMPEGSSGRDVFTEVFNDMKARRQYGIKEYGMPLKTNNGRDAINDLLQEQYDSFVYTKQLQMEIDDETEDLKRVAFLVCGDIPDAMMPLNKSKVSTIIKKILARREKWSS